MVLALLLLALVLIAAVRFNEKRLEWSPSWTTDKLPVVISLRPLKSVYRAGEPVWIEVKYTVISQAVEIVSCDCWREARNSYSFSCRHESGARPRISELGKDYYQSAWKHQDYWGGSCCLSDGAYKTGQGWSETLNLNDYLDFSTLPHTPNLPNYTLRIKRYGAVSNEVTFQRSF